MNELCEKYIKIINDMFGEQISSIIIYGSNIYNVSSSDLDVCLIAENKGSYDLDRIICETLKFHETYGLKLDEEIPHKNKLVYSFDEIEDTLQNPPFYNNGQFVINDIIKTKEFLNSEEMKKRLLLNILTTDHLVVGNRLDRIKKYEAKAWDILLEVVTEYFNLTSPSVSDILQVLYVNPYTGAEGEMYLGYKKNYTQKQKYLIKQVEEAMERRDNNEAYRLVKK